MANCPKCGLPVFHGPSGYAEDACKCFWQSQPAQSTEIDTLRARIVKLEAKLRVAEEAPKLSESVLAATQEVYGACFGPKTHEGIEAALAKIKEAS